MADLGRRTGARKAGPLPQLEPGSPWGFPQRDGLWRVPLVIIAAGVLTALAYFLVSPGAAALWAIGMGLGYALQRARLCFAGTFRDLFLFGDSGPLRGLLVLLFASTIGFAVVQYLELRTASPAAALPTSAVPRPDSLPPGYFAPFGLSTAVGAFLFGIGMVLAAGCASGTLVRVGEGFGYAILALFGMGIGSAVGAYQSPAWTGLDAALGIAREPVFLGRWLGWPAALLLQLSLLAGLYRLSGRKKG